MNDENTIWLVIRNADYYPCGGTDDWIGLYATKDLAEAKVAELRQQSRYPNDWYLCIVAIDLPNLTWQERQQ